MIAKLVAWGRRRKIRRLGRKVSKLKLRRAKDAAYLAYWSRMYIADTDGYKSRSECNLEAELNASIAAADFKLGELEPQLLELEKAELGIGLWEVEKEQAARLAHIVMEAGYSNAAEKRMAKAVLAWAEPK